MTSELAITAFAVSIIAAIMFHELGHFWTARRFGMRADRFFLGFGPTLWSVQRGETEFGVKALPLGGFVRIRGMAPSDERRPPLVDAVFDPDAVARDRQAAADREGTELRAQPAVPRETWERLEEELRIRGTPEDLAQRITERTRRNVDPEAVPPEVRSVLEEVLATEVPDTGRVGDLCHRLVKGDEGRFFKDRPAWQRAIVLAAGSASHFLLAVVLLLLGYGLLPQAAVVPVVDEVVEGSPAEAAGLQPGDRIVAVDDVRSDDYDVLRQSIQQRGGETTTIEVRRDSELVQLRATPELVTDEATGQIRGRLGFVAQVGRERLSFTEAVEETFVGPVSITSITVRTVEAMGQVFGPEGLGSIASQLTGEEQRGGEAVGSIVGVAATAGQGTAMFGWMFFVLMLVSVNVFIGLFNILPLPPLDGGHLAVLAVERGVNGVRSRLGRPADFSVDPRTVAAIALPVVVLLGVLTVALLWLDITNPIQLQ